MFRPLPDFLQNTFFEKAGKNQPIMSMKKRVAEVVTQTLETLKANGILEFSQVPNFQVDIPKVADHGDFATNAALILAKSARRSPRQLAELIRDTLNPPAGMFAKVEIAGPGFINFFIQDTYWLQVLADIEAAQGTYGNSTMGVGQKSAGGIRQRQSHRPVACRPRSRCGPGRRFGEYPGLHRPPGGAGILYQRCGRPNTDSGLITFSAGSRTARAAGGLSGKLLPGRLSKRIGASNTSPPMGPCPWESLRPKPWRPAAATPERPSWRKSGTIWKTSGCVSTTGFPKPGYLRTRSWNRPWRPYKPEGIPFRSRRRPVV